MPPVEFSYWVIALDLTRAEMVRLAFAYSFERRAEEFVTLPA